jgi:hypothetical protein
MYSGTLQSQKEWGLEREEAVVCFPPAAATKVALPVGNRYSYPSNILYLSMHSVGQICTYNTWPNWAHMDGPFYSTRGRRE